MNPTKRARPRLAPALFLPILLAWSPSGPTAEVAEELVLRPKAAVETEPVASEGDAADDPAIWIHPGDPARSLVLGTDKKGGLNVFDLDGKRLQVVSPGSRPNNVDVLYGFTLGDKVVDLAIAGVRTESKYGLAFWQIDPDSRTLSELGPIPSVAVFGGGEPYGSCVYRSPKDRATYVFVSNKAGGVEQYQIDGKMGSIRANRVRTIEVGSQVEGCVADFDLGFLYLAEEDVGIWKYGAEPNSGSSRSMVARVSEHGLTADVEGLTIYYGSANKGYLIASSQGNDTFKVFDREGANAFVATVDPQPGTTSDVGETDGIDVTNAPTSGRFPRGLFVVQDGKARDKKQNFKFFAWEEVAGERLLVDPSRTARPR